MESILTGAVVYIALSCYIIVSKLIEISSLLSMINLRLELLLLNKAIKEAEKGNTSNE